MGCTLKCFPAVYINVPDSVAAVVVALGVVTVGGMVPGVKVVPGVNVVLGSGVTGTGVTGLFVNWMEVGGGLADCSTFSMSVEHQENTSNIILTFYLLNSESEQFWWLNVKCLFSMYCVLIFVYVDVTHGAAVMQVTFQT